MRLLRLEAENFGSHEQLDLDLSGVAQAVIVGPNGAGKSTLLRMIEWAFYGGSPDEALNFDAQRGGVTVTFERDGKTWKVSRGRERERKSWLVVEGDGQALTKESLNESQSFLEESVLGMDREGFRSSVFTPQGEAGAFVGLNAGQRKALLAGLLGLDEYEVWRQTAAKERRAREAQAELLAQERDTKDGRLSSLRYQDGDDPMSSLGHRRDGLHERIRLLDLEMTKAVERERASERMAVRAQLELQMDDLQRRATASRKSDEVRARLAPVAAEAASLRERLTAYEGREEAFQRGRVVKAQIETLKAQGRSLDAALKANRQRLKAVKAENRCPTCGQAASGEHLVQALAQIEEEGARVSEQRSELKAEISGLTKKVPDAKGYDPKAHAQVRQAAKKAETAEAKLAGMGEPEDVRALRDQWKKLRDQVKRMPDSIPAGPLPDAVREDQGEARREMLEVERKIEQAKHDAEQAKGLEEEIADLDSRLTKLQAENDALGTLTQAFSRSGIPAMMLENAVDVIEDAANDMLRQLGAPFALRLSTTAEKKAGGTKDTLDILVDHGGRERRVETYSGGEKYRVHIALRTGLAAMMAARAGGRCDFMLIDEPTDLDRAGMEALSDLLTSMDKQIILVTHHDEIVERFPQVVEVRRQSDVTPSQVEVR